MGASVRPPPVLIKALGELIGAKPNAGMSGQAQPSGASSPSYSGSPGALNIPGPARVPAIGADAGVAIAFERDETGETWASTELPGAEPEPTAAPLTNVPTAAAFGPADLARVEREMAEAEERE